jgi:hypothetical protein
MLERRGVRVLTTLLLTGCSLFSGDPAAAVADADAKLKSNDLAGAAAAYEAALTEHPESVEVATGAAYLRLLKGDTAGADAALAGVEAAAAERVGEVKVRRALVALQAGDLDAMNTHATASNLPVGALLAGEYQLAEGNPTEARSQLQAAAKGGGPVGEAAGQYLRLMSESNPLVAGMAEAQALWALGQRPVAVRSVTDLVKAYAETHGDTDGTDMLLLWAGRAAAIGEAEVATGLLDSIVIPPAGQTWRLNATRAMAACAAGDGATCVAGFNALDTLVQSPDGAGAGIPVDGLSDARVTAAFAIADKDPDTARALVAGLRGDGAARLLAKLNDPANAAMVAADPLLKAQFGG